MRIMIKNFLQNYTVVNKLYKLIFTKIFWLAFLGFNTNKKIIFSSFSGRTFNDSPKVLFDLITQDPDFSDYRLIWAFDKPRDFNHTVKDTVKIS